MDAYSRHLVASLRQLRQIVKAVHCSPSPIEKTRILTRNAAQVHLHTLLTAIRAPAEDTMASLRRCVQLLLEEGTVFGLLPRLLGGHGRRGALLLPLQIVGAGTDAVVSLCNRPGSSTGPQVAIVVAVLEQLLDDTQSACSALRVLMKQAVAITSVTSGTLAAGAEVTSGLAAKCAAGWLWLGATVDHQSGMLIIEQLLRCTCRTTACVLSVLKPSDNTLQPWLTAADRLTQALRMWRGVSSRVVCITAPPGASGQEPVFADAATGIVLPSDGLWMRWLFASSCKDVPRLLLAMLPCDVADYGGPIDLATEMLSVWLCDDWQLSNQGECASLRKLVDRIPVTSRDVDAMVTLALRDDTRDLGLSRLLLLVAKLTPAVGEDAQQDCLASLWQMPCVLAVKVITLRAMRTRSVLDAQKSLHILAQASQKGALPCFGWSDCVMLMRACETWVRHVSVVEADAASADMPHVCVTAFRVTVALLSARPLLLQSSACFNMAATLRKSVKARTVLATLRQDAGVLRSMAAFAEEAGSSMAAVLQLLADGGDAASRHAVQSLVLLMPRRRLCMAPSPLLRLGLPEGDVPSTRAWDARALRSSRTGRNVLGCWSSGCPNLSGASEGALRLKTCKQCSVAQYCDRRCQRHAWRCGHRAACGRQPAP